MELSVCEGTRNSWLIASLDGLLALLGLKVDIMQSGQQTAGDWYSMFFGSLHPKLSKGNKYFKPQHLIALKQESSRQSWLDDRNGAMGYQGVTPIPENVTRLVRSKTQRFWL